MSDSPRLHRTLGGIGLTLYGVGTMVGGGFYALSGRVAGEVGLLAPLAFGLAGALALLSALSFAELSSRLPHAGGSARYVEAAFSKSRLAAAVGWAIIATGVVSAATLAVATVGFVRDFVAVPVAPATVALVLVMGAVAAWGVKQAVGVVVAITVVEVGALLYVGASAALTLPADVAAPVDLFVPGSAQAWPAVLAAAFLAFYAFIGFEDMVTLAEETRGAGRVVPRALLAALAITTGLYVVVSALVVLAVPVEQLASASTPLAEPVRGQGAWAVALVGGVSILTGINGALVQIVMAARVAYGMAERGYAPGPLSRVSAATRTPLPATLLATVLVAVLALLFDLQLLAETTSGIILAVFAAVNAGLWWMKRRPLGEAALDLPRVVPLVGALASAGVLASRLVGVG